MRPASPGPIGVGTRWRSVVRLARKGRLARRGHRVSSAVMVCLESLVRSVLWASRGRKESLGTTAHPECQESQGRLVLPG
jgi:hypothetical protein